MNLISISIKLYFLWLFKFSTQRKPHDSNHHSLDLVGATVYNLYDLYRRVLLLKCWSGDRWRVEGQFEEPGSSRTRNSFSSCHERMWGRAGHVSWCWSGPGSGPRSPDSNLRQLLWQLDHRHPTIEKNSSRPPVRDISQHTVTSTYPLLRYKIDQIYIWKLALQLHSVIPHYTIILNVCRCLMLNIVQFVLLIILVGRSLFRITRSVMMY